MRAIDAYSTQKRAKDVAIGMFSRFNEK